MQAYRFVYKAAEEKDPFPSRAEYLPVDPSALPCMALVFDIKSHQAICAVHNDKSRVCEGYPFFLSDLLPGCGFSFV
jgi:hypothetical protein